MNDSPSIIVGIDLGTTYSLVSVLSGDEPTLIPNSLGEVLTPSVVSVDEDGRILVGAAAKSRMLTHPERTAATFKRDMGTRRELALQGNQPLSPEQLSAFVLLSLKQDAEAFLDRPVSRAVITVPAYFGDLQRQATKDAATIAGLDVVRIINEPTAAALAYGFQNMETKLRAVVLDLGGGTFDVTVLEIDEGVVEIRSSAGDARLGGEDFTDTIAALVRSRIEEHHGPIDERMKTSWLRIRESAEHAKKRLSLETETTISMQGLELGRGAVDVTIRIRRDEVAAACAPLLARIRQPIGRALRDARMLPVAIDEVLLVGGASRMPWFVDLAREQLACAPRDTLPPDEAVALGAAIQAGLHASARAVDDLVVTDVAPFSLGIETSLQERGSSVPGLFTPILERGTVIPASREQSFSTTVDDQTKIVLSVFQGEHALVRDNVKLGELKVTGIPKARAGHARIDVRFTYDLDGILDVDVKVVGSSKAFSLVIERNPGQLTKAQVASARRAMARMKFHPREALPNRTALARAEAAYVELRGPEREMLLFRIGAFKLALQSQDPSSIEGTRFLLVSTTNDLRIK